MPIFLLTDAEIATLIHEPKNTPSNLFPLTKLVERDKHKRRDYGVTSPSGNEFVIAVRQSTLDVLNFSAILGYKMPGYNTVFRLRRYNGKHEHTNAIERTKLDDFHIHTATERYQKRGLREDFFAEVTSNHWNLDSALRCLLEDCAFDPPPPAAQSLLFGPPTP
jgi:hypothetical protein